MDKLIIEGGYPLKGEVKISGAKNAALPIMAAALLTDEPSIIKNVPNLRDIWTMVKLLRSLGAKVHFNDGVVKIEPGGVKEAEAPYELVSTMRASICVLGPLLARLKKARVSMPGGCIIGPRPIDLHIKGIRALNAEVNIEGGYIVAKTQGLKGDRIYLGGAFGSSVLATANVIMAAVLAEGKTFIENAACEPEIVDLVCFLRKMGAKIEGEGSHIIEIDGVRTLKGVAYSIISDRIEAGTYILAGAITGGEVVIKDAFPRNMCAVIDKLRQTGILIEEIGDDLRISTNGKFRPVDIVTLPYPGFPTDMQAQMMALMSITEGISVITEKVYPERFMHISELTRMGAYIILEGATAIVRGVGRLSGAPVMASDLRASAALVLAGLAAEGRTEISRIYHLDRGYEKIEEKLSALGARIWRERE